MITADPILQKYHAVLAEVYDDRIERVVVFGSLARGDANPDSDYDVALFLNNLTDAWQEIDRLVELEETVRVATNTDTLPFPAGGWRERTPLMHEIRKDGLDL